MWDKKQAQLDSGHTHAPGSAAPLDPGRLLTGNIAPNSYLQSANYVENTSGWKLFGSGNLEANDGFFRGDISAATGGFDSIEIGTSPNWFKVDENGNSWWGAVNLVDAPAYVKKDGTAKFKSIILESNVKISGIVAGSAIGVEFLTAGTIDSVSIVLDSSSSDAEIRSGIASGDFNNTGANSGFIIGVDFDDSSKGKFYFGNVARHVKFDGTDLIINGYILSSKGAFGGDGFDGDVTISTDTNLDAGTATFLVKQYDNFTIDDGYTLGLTNINTDYGTLLVLKIKGDFVWNGAIDLSGKGASAGRQGAFTVNPNFSFTESIIFGANQKHLTFNLSSAGRGGMSGSPNTAGAKDAGGGGGGGSKNNGTNGNNGSDSGYSGVTGQFHGLGGKGGLKQFGWDAGPTPYAVNKMIPICCGSGGGTGGVKLNSTPGIGGNGGGGILIEVSGNITIGVNATIILSGEDGGDATDQASPEGAGGGGGGSAGIGLLLYNGSFTDNGLTITVLGGAGGASTQFSGAGRAGSDGLFKIDLNTSFA